MAGTWFKRVTWLGIAANAALALPTLIAPEWMIALSNLPPAAPVVWPRFAALLLLLLSVFCVPAAHDYTRYRATAWSAVAARLAGVIFFVGFQSREYHVLGYFDLAFFVPEAIPLTLASRGAARARPVVQAV
jgi:hypothetical protein